MSTEAIRDSSKDVRDETTVARSTPLWRKAIPYVGTLAIFALIFW